MWCDEACDEDEHIHGPSKIASGSTIKLAAMIHALRETSSTCELVADVAKELTCREISSTSMTTSLIQKNSPEAEKKEKRREEKDEILNKKEKRKAKKKRDPHHPKIVLWLLSMHRNFSE